MDFTFTEIWQIFFSSYLAFQLPLPLVYFAVLYATSSKFLLPIRTKAVFMIYYVLMLSIIIAYYLSIKASFAAQLFILSILHNLPHLLIVHISTP